MEDLHVTLIHEKSGNQKEFVLPLNNEEVMQELNATEDDVFLVECDIKGIDMSMVTVEQLNDMYYKIQELDKDILNNIETLINEHFTDFHELYDSKDRLIFYENIGTPLELASWLIEDGLYGDIPEKLKYYLDYESLGNDIEIEFILIKVNDGLFVID